LLRSRIIPCLLVHKKGLVKTVKFKNPKYVGDPLNAVKIFNEKEVDEIMLLDIDASKNSSDPDYELIKNIANECRMPLCYGGGIKTPEQALKIIQLGAEKVAISSLYFEKKGVLSSFSKLLGSQSVVIVLDVKKSLFGAYEIYINNGKVKVKKSLKEVLNELEEANIGEIVVNSIDNDGIMKGYDKKLASIVRESVSCPVTILGGAGSIDDILDLVKTFKIIGAAAGSLFVFKGKYRAVLINYLDDKTKEKIRLLANSREKI
tara:strand:+ start:887 stop:1672 length:786 start_codon:yes stop_codon:yes gene_type:complete